MNQQHIDDLVDAFILGALEPDEVAAVDAHLATCDHCRELVANSREVADMLVYATPLVEPPAGLRDRVRASVRAVAQSDAGDVAAATATSREAQHGRLRSALRALLGDDAFRGDVDRPAVLLAQLLSKPDCAIWPVAGTNDAPQASARFVGVATSREGV